uniref:Uncharacterized protein n=1 Tax=Arundo donax TaxID=35708 RepID=A0A0A9BCN4_ARUDO
MVPLKWVYWSCISLNKKK